MATYSLTQDVLNVEVSCFANYNTPSNPKPVNLYAWLTNTKYRDKVVAIRAESEKLKRDELKATLPAITPSGVFTYRQAASLVPGGHSRLIQFDIDWKDNPRIRNYADLKAQLCKLPFVAYCGLSVSGTGYWGLVPIAHAERHGQHFDALKRVFAHYGIMLDDKPRNVASLRGYSYDSDAYFAQQVMLFDLYDEPQPVPVRAFTHTVDADAERQRVEVCISEISRRAVDITSGYNNWYAIGCDIASTFGEGGREYFHIVSQCHPEYQQASCDKQYTHCLRSYKDVQLKTFFGRCRDSGITWKDLLPYEPSERTTPLKNNLETCTRPTYKTGKSTQVPSVQVPTLPKESDTVNSSQRIEATVYADVALIVELPPDPVVDDLPNSTLPLVRLPKTLEYKWTVFARPPFWWNKIATYKSLIRCIEPIEPVTQTVSTLDELLAVPPGNIIRPDPTQLESLLIEPRDGENYPAEWDEPSPPTAQPTIRQRDFFEWQRTCPPFNRLGLASLPQKQP